MFTKIMFTKTGHSIFAHSRSRKLSGPPRDFASLLSIYTLYEYRQNKSALILCPVSTLLNKNYGILKTHETLIPK
jgi:hypothetical protein